MPYACIGAAAAAEHAQAQKVITLCVFAVSILKLMCYMYIGYARTFEDAFTISFIHIFVRTHVVCMDY